MTETKAMEISESARLIEPNETDRLLAKLESINSSIRREKETEEIQKKERKRQEKILAKEEQTRRGVKELRICFVLRFVKLYCELFNTDKKSLEILSRDNILILDNLLAKEVKSRAISQKILIAPFYLIPVIGWSILQGLTPLNFYNYDRGECYCSGLTSWGYLRDRKRLKKIYGGDYFPYKELLEVVEEKQMYKISYESYPVSGG